jgi:hypothetical protein
MLSWCQRRLAAHSHAQHRLFDQRPTQFKGAPNTRLYVDAHRLTTYRCGWLHEGAGDTLCMRIGSAPQQITNSNTTWIDRTFNKSDCQQTVADRFNGHDSSTLLWFFGATPVGCIKHHSITRFKRSCLTARLRLNNDDIRTYSNDATHQ